MPEAAAQQTQLAERRRTLLMADLVTTINEPGTPLNRPFTAETDPDRHARLRPELAFLQVCVPTRVARFALSVGYLPRCHGELYLPRIMVQHVAAGSIRDIAPCGLVQQKDC